MFALLRCSIAGFAALCVLAACSPEGGSGPREGFASTDITGANYASGFHLTDHRGQARTLADYKGKVVTLFFGYTQCPDVCPTNLLNMAQVMRELGPDADRVQVLFITVDPERDTQELLAQYVPAFDSRFVGLYGDLATTQAVARDFKVFYQMQGDVQGGRYTVDHSTGTYVFDPQGRLRLYIKHGEKPAAIVADLKRLLAGK
ncbi:SCO family protein [Zoogloea sp. LCSB751]|uniref:SCO family protein n=1 Tax=Zoogloea sp. LCSB751 TaxID=1965277 RepID=UPI0009A5140F|nr:SCO family protein [Zoogloea sp. LCSB751]